MAGSISVKRDTLRKAINDGRLSEPAVTLPDSSTLSERSQSDADAGLGMGTACTRPAERLRAAIGWSDGALTRFESCGDVPNGGVLCALPALLANGLLTGIEKLGLVNGYYTAKQVLLVMGLMFLSRLKKVEQLKGCSPGEFGKLVGLDRVPEGRCLRRKMDDLAGGGKVEEWSASLSRQWLEGQSPLTGFLYVDGHVKVYSGDNKLPRRFVSRERLCLRGISNYWVNDALGRPFFAIEKQIDPGLIQTLDGDVVPRLLEEVPNQPSEKRLADDKDLHRFVIVFDREAYSPEFFRKMWDSHRIACLTYRKNCSDKWPTREFRQVRTAMPDGETVEMRLAERGTLLGGDGVIWVKEVRKLTESGHQTAMVTTAKSLDAERAAPAMFTRWCQENFFGYAVKHFPVDLLTSYGMEKFDGAEKLVNPEWRQLDRQRNSAMGKLIRRRAKYQSMDSQVSADPNHKQYKKWLSRKAELLEEIQIYEDEVNELAERKRKTPHHITWDELPEAEKFMRMPSSRRSLVNTVAMVAYRAETALASIMQSQFPTLTSTKARVMLQSLFKRSADILPDYESETLHIRVHGASTPADNEKLSMLVEELNSAETIYPQTNLKIIFELIKSSELVT